MSNVIERLLDSPTGRSNVSLLQTMKIQLIKRTKGGDVAARSMGITVGRDCRILSLEAGSEPWLVTIGDRVTISSGVQFLTHDGAGWLYRDEYGRRYRYARIEIGSDVFVGNRSIIMPGVRIGDRCVVGAGSVVTRSVPDGSVVAGNPARMLTTYDELMSRIAEWTPHSAVEGLDIRRRSEYALEKDFLPYLKA